MKFQTLLQGYQLLEGPSASRMSTVLDNEDFLDASAALLLCHGARRPSGCE